MVVIYDVPTDVLAEETAGQFKDRIGQPDWMAFAKSGQIHELSPRQDDFWYTRSASLFHRVVMDGPVDIDRLSTKHGGPRHDSNRYSISDAHNDASSKDITRTFLQQFEEGGLVGIAKGEGCRITAEGANFLDDAAPDIFSDLDRPEFERHV